MRVGYTFFTSEDSKLALLESFKKERDSLFNFQEVLDEIVKPPEFKNIDPDTKLWAEVSMYRMMSWADFESFPRWRLLEFIAWVNSKQEEGHSTSSEERAIMSAVNRVFSAMNKDDD